MKHILIILAAIGLIAGIGCARYQRQIPSFILPEGAANVQRIDKALISAYSYKDRKEAEEAFGFDIRDAGLLPVQVVIDNRGHDTFEIQPSQTFLIDDNSGAWPVLDSELAYQRLAAKTEIANIIASSVKPGILGGMVGAVVGAAIGVVTGENVAESAGKGAAVGATAGAILGGTHAVTSKTAEEKITEDLWNRNLKNKKIKPGELIHGFIFFPGEAKSTKELKLKLKETITGKTYSIILEL